MEYLATTPGLIFLFLLGLCIGSFLNLVCHRLPLMMIAQWLGDARDTLGEFDDKVQPQKQTKAAKGDASGQDDTTFNLSTPRSHCPHCEQQISNRDLIPLVSFILLSGRCRKCAASISPQYPAVELGAALIAILPFIMLSNPWQAAGAVIAGWIMLCLAVIDFQRGWLPDNLTLALLWMGLACNSFSLFVSPTEAILGAALAYLFLRLVFIIFKWLTGKPGMGHGDFKLFAAAGAWLGPYALSSTLLIAAIGGILYVLTLIYLSKWKSGTPIPFGPWLALSIWLHFLLEDNKMLFAMGFG